MDMDFDMAAWGVVSARQLKGQSGYDLWSVTIDTYSTTQRQGRIIRWQEQRHDGRNKTVKLSDRTGQNPTSTKEWALSQSGTTVPAQ